MASSLSVGSGRDPQIVRLRAELADEGVPLPMRGEGSALFLGELAYARRPRVHERYIPCYGAVLPSTVDVLHELDESTPVQLVTVPDADLDHLRRFADGRASFLVRRPGASPQLACFRHSLEYESDLVRLQRSTGASVIQRTQQGAVRVFTGDTIVTWDGVRWVAKPPARRIQASIESLVPQVSSAILAGILEFCAHWLSPAYVGATIVWYLTEPAATQHANIDLAASEAAPALNLAERAHYPALLSVLRQKDGALTVGPDGMVSRLGGILRASDHAADVVPVLWGTRHTSARRFSFDEPSSLVFVVSEDGPVSVFSDGARTALVRNDQTWVRPPGSIKQRVSGHATRDVECATCGKQLIVDLSAAGQEPAACPVCHDPIMDAADSGAVVGIRKHTQ